MSDILSPTTLVALDPDKPSFLYVVQNALGKKREKLLRWNLSVVAQRELAKANLSIDDLTVESWMHQFSQGCPSIEVEILSFMVTAPQGATSVAELYWNDKLTDEFVAEVTGNFTQSSVLNRLVLSQMRVAELEALLKTANTPSTSSEPSPSTESETAPISDTKTDATEPSEQA